MSGVSSLGSRASAFQTADSAASSNCQGRSLVKCKMSNECEVCQVCRFLSQSFSFSCILRKVPTANLAELNFPLVCDDAIRSSPPKGFCSVKLHASPDLVSYGVTSLATGALPKI